MQYRVKGRKIFLFIWIYCVYEKQHKRNFIKCCFAILMKRMERKMSKLNERKRNVIGILKLLPLQFILVVLPLIVKCYQADSGYSVYPWYGNSGAYSDMFLHYKMVVFTLLSAVIFLLTIGTVICRIRRKEKIISPALIPVAVYVLGVVLSTIYSVNREYSMTGTMDQKEPVWVLLGYVIAAIYAVLCMRDEKDVRRLFSAAVLGGAFMAVIGVLQALSNDPFRWEWVQRLIMGNEYIDNYGFFTIKFEEGRAFGTIYNPNYVGSYVALYLPMALGGILVFRKLWSKLFSGLVTGGLLIFLFASQSRTGIMAALIALIIGLFFMMGKVFHYWYFVIPLMFLGGILFVDFDALNDHVLSNRIRVMFAVEKDSSELHWIDTTGRGVKVGYKDTEFTIKLDGTSDNFTYTVTENGKKKEVRYEDGTILAYFTLDDGEEIKLQKVLYDETIVFNLNLDGNNYYFYKNDLDGNYRIKNDYGRSDECIHAENVFENYGRVASGRGYAWGITIPLLKDHIFVGSGPDTFMTVFPQNDYVACANAGMKNIVFSRPHNFYLQMGVQTGVMSLAAFLVFFAYYFISSCRRYFWKQLESREQWVGFAVFISTIGFMIAGIANDSLIVVTPMFYVLLGMGVAINTRFCPLKKRKEKQEVTTKENQEAMGEDPQTV